MGRGEACQIQKDGKGAIREGKTGVARCWMESEK